MSSKANDRLAKLASFGASAATKQTQHFADPAGAKVEQTKASEDSSSGPAETSPSKPVAPPAHSAPMIRNIAFTAQEQEILRMLMDRLRAAGELTPNLSLAVKVGLRLIPEHPSPEAVRQAVVACKALDGRRKAARSGRER